MSAPERLTARQRHLWRQAERELRARGTWRPTCAPLLERMVLNRVAAEEAMDRAVADPEVRGSQGQLVRHPAWAIAATCDRIAISIARELGLTPSTATAAKTVAPSAAEPAAPADPGRALDELARRRRAG